MIRKLLTWLCEQSARYVMCNITYKPNEWSTKPKFYTSPEFATRDIFVNEHGEVMEHSYPFIEEVCYQICRDNQLHIEIEVMPITDDGFVTLRYGVSVFRDDPSSSQSADSHHSLALAFLLSIKQFHDESTKLEL